MTRAMNVTVVTTIFPPDIGGPAIYVSEILDRLSKKGHHVKVVTSSKVAQPKPNIYVLPKMRIMKLKFIGFFITCFVLFLLVLRVSKDSDVIYIQNPTLLGLISLLVGKVLKKPVVLKFVGDKPWEAAFNSGKTKKFLEGFLQSLEGGAYIKFLFWLQKFVLKRVGKVVVPSLFLKEILVNYYHINPEKIKVIYNSTKSLNYQNLSSKNYSLPDEPVIITVGRLVKHKKIDEIIRAVKDCAREYSNIRLLIVGDGPEEENLKKLSCELGIEENVKFYGGVRHSKVLELIRSASIFVLNSLYEGLPHVVIEAMACRTPVIATNIKGTNEVVKDGKTGLLVSPNNSEELKEKIIKLLRDRGLRKKLVENAYKSVENKFTWEGNLSVLENELRDVV